MYCWECIYKLPAPVDFYVTNVVAKTNITEGIGQLIAKLFLSTARYGWFLYHFYGHQNWCQQGDSLIWIWGLIYKLPAAVDFYMICIADKMDVNKGIA